jgi:hypothetical protein
VTATRDDGSAVVFEAALASTPPQRPTTTRNGCSILQYVLRELVKES